MYKNSTGEIPHTMIVAETLRRQGDITVEDQFVAWEDRFNVGIEMIDEQHKQLIKLTNDLYIACQISRNEAHAAFKVAIKAAVDYVKYHFKDEEHLMVSNRYEDYPAHKLKHEEFVKKVLSGVSDFELGKPFVPNSFVRYLRDWLLEHIAVTDKKFGMWLLARGIK